MTRNFKLIIEYDGSRYHGWQRQKGVRSVQGEIEKALATITAGSVSLTGSGRTDAGVHAAGQVVHFDTAGPIPAERWVKATEARGILGRLRGEIRDRFVAAGGDFCRGRGT